MSTTSSLPLNTLVTPPGGTLLAGGGFLKSPSSNQIFKQMTGTTPNSNGTGTVTFNNYDSNWISANNSTGVQVASPGAFLILLTCLGGGLSSTSPAGYVDLTINIAGTAAATNRYNTTNFSSYNGFFQCLWNVVITNPATQYIGATLGGGNWTSGSISSPIVQIIRIASL